MTAACAIPMVRFGIDNETIASTLAIDINDPRLERNPW